MKMKHTCVRENRIGLVCHESQIRVGEYYKSTDTQRTAYTFRRMEDDHYYVWINGGPQYTSPNRLWNNPHTNNWINHPVQIIEGPEG